MSKVNRVVEMFKPILDKIKDLRFKEDVVSLLEGLPDYVVTHPASSSKKYHPADECEKYGMVKHIFRCAVLVDEIIRMREHTQDEADILYAGCVVHDVLKAGLKEQKHTHKEHPYYSYDAVRKYLDGKYSITKDHLIPSGNPITNKLELLSYVCAFHSGIWTTPKVKKELGPFVKYLTKSEKILCESMHLADMFSSRRSIYDMMKDDFHTVED